MSDTPLRIALIASPPERAVLVRWLQTAAPDCAISELSGAADLLSGAVRPDDFDLIAVGFGQGSLSRRDLLAMVREMGTRLPEAPVVIIPDREEALPVAEALRHGARGYIPLTLAPATAWTALQLVLAGATFATVGAVRSRTKGSPGSRPHDTKVEE